MILFWETQASGRKNKKKKPFGKRSQATVASPLSHCQAIARDARRSSSSSSSISGRVSVVGVVSSQLVRRCRQRRRSIVTKQEGASRNTKCFVSKGRRGRVATRRCDFILTGQFWLGESKEDERNKTIVRREES